MVNSVSNLNTNQTTNTTGTQGTTSSPPANGVQSPFGTVRATVGTGVGGVAVSAALTSSKVFGLVGAYDANGQQQLTAAGLSVSLEGQVKDLQAKNQTLSEEINKFQDALNDPAKADPNDFNEPFKTEVTTLKNAQAKFDTDKANKASQETLDNDQKAINEAKTPLQTKLDADIAQRTENGKKITQSQNQAAASSVDEARSQLASALKPFGNLVGTDATLERYEATAKAATKNANDANLRLVVQTQADQQTQQQGAVLASTQVVASEQQKKELEQAISRGERARRDGVKALRAAGARDGETPISVAELTHRERTEPDAVLSRESGRGNGAEQADDAAQGSANAQGPVAFAEASGVPITGNAVDGRATATVAAGQPGNLFDDGVNPFDDGTNPLRGDDPDFFGIYDKSPFEIEPGTQMKQGVGVDQLVPYGSSLLNDLNKLSELLHQLDVPGGSLSRGLPYHLAANGDQDRVRVPV